MTVGIECTECNEEVVFIFDGEEYNPRSTCECGQTYELQVTKVYSA